MRVRSISLVPAALALFTMASSGSAQIITVTPSNPQGWQSYDYGNGHSGITGTYPRSGNGSVELDVPSNLNDYADFGYTFPNNSGFQLSTLAELGYDWYRSSASTTNADIAPAFDLYMSDNTFLVYEQAYNTNDAPAPVDTWVSAEIRGAKFWRSATSGQPAGCNTYDQFTTLDAFNTQCYGGQGKVIGFDVFMGFSVAGSFYAAADDVRYATVLPDPIFNFELDATSATVPEPATMSLLAIGLVGLAGARRRRK